MMSSQGGAVDLDGEPAICHGQRFVQHYEEVRPHEGWGSA